MSHPHPHPQTPPAAGPRQPSPEAQIMLLNQRLDAKAQDIRRLEDREIQLAAILNDLEGQVQMVTQLRAENVILRARLGLPETGAIELTDSEAGAVAADGAHVTEQADDEPVPAALPSVPVPSANGAGPS